MGLAARYTSGYLRTTPVPGKPRQSGQMRLMLGLLLVWTAWLG